MEHVETQSDNTKLTKLDALVRKFKPVKDRKGVRSKLAPFRKQITALRKKGASYKEIQGVLKQIGVNASAEYIGSFLRIAERKS